jgi:hypothetical protein
MKLREFTSESTGNRETAPLVNMLAWDGADTAGVYALYSQGVLQYIGQTQSVLARIAVHRSLGRILFDCVRVLPEPDRVARREMERALIAQHRPPFNQLLLPKPAVEKLLPTCQECGCTFNHAYSRLCFPCRARAAYRRQAALHESARQAFINFMHPTKEVQ